MESLRKKCVCPTCKVPVQVKGLHKNLTFSTLVACAGKLKDILEAKINAQKMSEIFEETLVEDENNSQLTNISGRHGVIDDLSSRLSSEPEDEKENVKISANSLLATPKPLKEPEIENQSEPKRKKASKGPTPKITPSAPPKERMKTPASAPVERKKQPKTKEVRPDPTFPKETLKILMSGLKPDDKNLITEYHKEVEKGSKVQIASEYDHKTVNRIVMGIDDSGLCTRTTKYLRGILDGKPIVTYSWFFDSLAQKQWLSPIDFLVKGDNSIGRETNAVKLSMQRPEGTKLFDAFTFYLVGRFGSPTKQDLNLLLKAGGAKVTSVRPKGSLPENHFIIYDPDLLDDGHLWITEYDQRTSGLWVLDCISSYEILPTY